MQKKDVIIGILMLLVIALGAFIIAEVAQAPETDTATPSEDRSDSDGEDTDNPDSSQGMSNAAVSEFKGQLEAGVRSELGQPIEGYEPFMFMQVFEGLEPSDFNGVDASIGTYVYEDGELSHDLEGETLIHSAAGAVTEAGIATLLQNVMERLDIEPDTDVSTITGTLDEEKVSDDPVACTMDAKQCPDGSFVGREGPECEFAECPPFEGTVCTQEMKQVDACAQIYAPVCGLVEVQCITEPCEPVPETFSNACTACSQGNVISYTEGECEI